MAKISRLPKRIPAGSKYVLESQGGFVRRFLELPNGRKLELATRKAEVCVGACAEASLVPALAPEPRKPVRRRARALERA